MLLLHSWNGCYVQNVSAEGFLIGSGQDTVLVSFRGYPYLFQGIGENNLVIDADTPKQSIPPSNNVCLLIINSLNINSYRNV
jgi:hypothetical protein